MSEEERDIYEDLTSYGPDGGSSGPISGVKVYDGQGYYVTVRLSDLNGCVLTEHDYEDGTAPKRGIFIPFKDAGLFVSPKKNVMLTCKMELAQVVSNHHTHLLTQIIDGDLINERRRLGYKHGFVGFAKPIGFGKKKR